MSIWFCGHWYYHLILCSSWVFYHSGLCPSWIIFDSFLPLFCPFLFLAILIRQILDSCILPPLLPCFHSFHFFFIVSTSWDISRPFIPYLIFIDFIDGYYTFHPQELILFPIISFPFTCCSWFLNVVYSVFENSKLTFIDIFFWFL